MIQSAPSAPGGDTGPPRVRADRGLVRKRGLVPMVAVRDEQALAGQEAGHPLVRLHRGEGVEQPVSVAGTPLVAPAPAHHVAIALGAIEVHRQDG